MRSSIFRDLLILIACAAVVFSIGYYIVKNVSLPGGDFGFDLSVDQEEKLGDMMKDGIWDNFPVAHSLKADSAVQVITDRLIGALDSTDYRYRFTILNSDQVNAFTIPGGNIYVFSGLIEMSKSPEEVAAVIAHEIGHAEKKHVIKKLVKEFSLVAVVGLLAGGDPSLIVQIIQQVVGSKFDREQEEEADEFALSLLEKAKIDPQNLAVFFARLNEKNLSYDKNLEIIMTHPHNDSRITRVRSYRTQRGFTPEKIDLDWDGVKKSLDK